MKVRASPESALQPEPKSPRASGTRLAPGSQTCPHRSALRRPWPAWLRPPAPALTAKTRLKSSGSAAYYGGLRACTRPPARSTKGRGRSGLARTHELLGLDHSAKSRARRSLVRETQPCGSGEIARSNGQCGNYAHRPADARRAQLGTGRAGKRRGCISRAARPARGMRNVRVGHAAPAPPNGERGDDEPQSWLAPTLLCERRG